MSEEDQQLPHSRKIERYGWLPDLPDHRDHLFSLPPQALEALPPKVDLTSQCPVVYDQSQLGSCTANAIAGAMEFDLIKQKEKEFTPARLFIYYNERAIIHTTNYDSGAYLRDGIKTVARQGCCHEALWPYILSKFKQKPPTQAYTDAMKFQALKYQRLNNTDLQMLKGCLAGGSPFVFGFTVYESFESDNVARTGLVPMPASSEKTIGGHAVMAVGYDEQMQRFIVRNSWGKGWGNQGYCTMPYQYLTNNNLADDFWAITLVESGNT